MAKKWICTVFLVYLLMCAYWIEAIIMMLREARWLDGLLFLALGFSSGTLGFSIVAIVNKVLKERINNLLLFLLASLLLSLLILFVISNKLIEVMTAT